MLLLLLEKLGRKRLLLDRGPSHPEYHKAKPWMNRYYVLFKKRPKWLVEKVSKLSNSQLSEPIISNNHLYVLTNKSLFISN